MGVTTQRMIEDLPERDPLEIPAEYPEETDVERGTRGNPEDTSSPPSDQSEGEGIIPQ